MPNQRRNIAVRKHTKGRRKLLTIEKRVIYLLLSAWLNVKGSWLNTKHPSRFAGSNPAALAFFFQIVIDNSPFSDIVPNMTRLTLKYITEWAKAQGIIVERVNSRRIDFYYADDHGTVGSSESVGGLWDDLGEFLR